MTKKDITVPYLTAKWQQLSTIELSFVTMNKIHELVHGVLSEYVESQPMMFASESATIKGDPTYMIGPRHDHDDKYYFRLCEFKEIERPVAKPVTQSEIIEFIANIQTKPMNQIPDFIERIKRDGITNE